MYAPNYIEVDGLEVIDLYKSIDDVRNQVDTCLRTAEYVLDDAQTQAAKLQKEAEALEEIVGVLESFKAFADECADIIAGDYSNWHPLTGARFYII